jgi:hypothetical protein
VRRSVRAGVARNADLGAARAGQRVPVLARQLPAPDRHFGDGRAERRFDG